MTPRGDKIHSKSDNRTLAVCLRRDDVIRKKVTRGKRNKIYNPEAEKESPSLECNDSSKFYTSPDKSIFLVEKHYVHEDINSANYESNQIRNNALKRYNC